MRAVAESPLDWLNFASSHPRDQLRGTSPVHIAERPNISDSSESTSRARRFGVSLNVQADKYRYTRRKLTRLRGHAMVNAVRPPGQGAHRGGSVDSEQPVVEQRPSLKRRIAHNSIWYGVEVAIGILATLATTILIARLIGPARLGYFNYIYWLSK